MDDGANASRAQTAARLLTAVQIGDAIACAIPLPVLQKDLDRLGCSPALQRALPVVKAASAAGLIVGTKQPRIGSLTSVALGGYFACALGAHARVRDPAWRYAPALAMGGLTVVASKAFGSSAR